MRICLIVDAVSSICGAQSGCRQIKQTRVFRLLIFDIIKNVKNQRIPLALALLMPNGVKHA